MQIRFFATNRDRQNLGRNIDRDTRIKLQKGGYHWVDMKKYMSHYLETTDPSSMPSEVIIENSQETVFENFLCKDAVKRIIIGVHGYNVPFHGALTSFSVLADSLSLALKKHDYTVVTDPDKTFPGNLDDAKQDLTAFVGFSWPSNGRVLDYQSDRAESIQTAPALANLISYIRTKKTQTKIHIIAHSMGSYLVCKMLNSLVEERFRPIYINDEIEQELKRLDKGGDNSYFVDSYVMLAPDVERREVTKCYVNSSVGNPFIGEFYSGLEHLVQKTHVFYSRYDNALKASVVEKDTIRESLQKGLELFTGPDLKKRWESSLGLNPLPALAPNNMYSYNATALTNRPIDHGDYFDAPAIIEKIAEIIIEADKNISSLPDIPWSFI
ncbi:alpha/beta hydrolase [Anabaena subtropica]|uniref:Alpha/beta hydrolase n=1 Tax=Anabaena subtropica FACHB-260 TaxID=2692884 RepID=A0ABR8CRE5_9NOST|nr:alpha/beta hydrolase [Anabaena subtropica]MBD2345609.1 alpha/beta hydrolase [Anabaena subtropica FACHB-260]